MPKLLVLLDAATPALAPIADAVADGARGVRFTEVDVRRLDARDPAAPASIRPLASLDELGTYDAIVVGAADGPAADGALAALVAHLAALGPHGALRDRVGAMVAIAPGTVAPLDAMARAGMLLVPPGTPVDATADGALALTLAPGDGRAPAAARALGHRVAEVAGWVRHARSHQHH